MGFPVERALDRGLGFGGDGMENFFRKGEDSKMNEKKKRVSQRQERAYLVGINRIINQSPRDTTRIQRETNGPVHRTRDCRPPEQSSPVKREP